MNDDLMPDEETNLALLPIHQLKDEVQFLHAVINHAGGPIFVKNAHSRIILANDSFCSLFGLIRVDVLGKTKPAEAGFVL